MSHSLKPGVVTGEDYKTLLKAAKEGGYALPAVNAVGTNSVNAVMEAAAKNKKIPVQFRTLSRSTGTDTDSFAYANDGCPSVLKSIPLRYMHTTVEMIHKKDIVDTIQLMYETLLQLSPKTNLNYL